MWIITNEQITAISELMRLEFEKRAFFIFQKEYGDNITEKKLKLNIHNQMERIIEYNIQDETIALQFIRLTFEHPMLQNNNWDSFLEDDLRDCKDENQILSVVNNYLN